MRGGDNGDRTGRLVVVATDDGLPASAVTRATSVDGDTGAAGGHPGERRAGADQPAPPEATIRVGSGSR